ncbi:hypothetical protein C8R43DRAFT_1105445 [Mycena crocata]|nr:hypothetical protein C8R43DRAFT_1105445 [Mycena crocata]
MSSSSQAWLRKSPRRSSTVEFATHKIKQDRTRLQPTSAKLQPKYYWAIQPNKTWWDQNSYSGECNGATSRQKEGGGVARVEQAKRAISDARDAPSPASIALAACEAKCGTLETKMSALHCGTQMTRISQDKRVKIAFHG